MQYRLITVLLLTIASLSTFNSAQAGSEWDDLSPQFFQEEQVARDQIMRELTAYFTPFYGYAFEPAKLAGKYNSSHPPIRIQVRIHARISKGLLVANLTASPSTACGAVENRH